MIKTAGYIRVSTKSQAEHGYSLQYQRESIEKCASERGFELTHIYEDAGKSGAAVDDDMLIVEREGLHQLLANLKKAPP